MSAVLIYDSSKNTGHHFEYIEAILKEVTRGIYRNTKYYFVLNNCMRSVIDENISNGNNYEIIFIDDYILEKWGRLNPLLRSISEIYYIHTLCLKKKVKRIIFLMIDTYQYALGINKSLFYDISIEGILFKPYTRYDIDKTGLLRYVKSMLFRFYKWLGVEILMNNRSKKRIWILNDRKSSHTFNSDFQCNSFHYLPDPVRNFGKVKKYDLLEAYGISKDNKILIVFGSISPFKNIENILKALSIINTLSITLLIIGSWASHKYKKYINSLIDTYLLERTNLQIIVEDRYFEDEEVDFLISKSHCVLIPYINFYFSSGVLGRSSSLGKPVIASKIGLCKELVESYSLGLTIDPHSPEEIADGIVKVLLGESLSSEEGMQRYVNERKYTHFAGTLLKL